MNDKQTSDIQLRPIPQELKVTAVNIVQCSTFSCKLTLQFQFLSFKVTLPQLHSCITVTEFQLHILHTLLPTET
jgi:hypothetical protein